MPETTKKSTDPAAHPFAFVSHGLWSYTDEIKSTQLYLLFEHEVPASERRAVEAAAPPPIAGPSTWAGGAILYQRSPPSRYFDAHVWRTYGGGKREDDEEDDGEEDDFELTEQHARAFCDALDAWLEEVHRKHPLTLVVWSRGDESDRWTQWSLDQLTGRVIPRIRALQGGLRPVAAGTSWQDTPEQLGGWMVWEAVATYLGERDPAALGPADREAMARAVSAHVGYDPHLDAKLDRLLRKLDKAAGSATPR